VIADLTTYEVLDVIGSGARGLDSGDFGEATFDTPQGMALNGSTLYVADTNNHAIRAVDLVARTVTTIAGTGEQNITPNTSGPPTEIRLNSPWDVEFDATGNILYIAMAGPHQLWALIFDRNVIGPLVGSGREGLLDGALAEAQLAQPSGLFFRGGLLYFADSESSSIRVADFTTDEVRTLAGPVPFIELNISDATVGNARELEPITLPAGEYYIGLVTDRGSLRVAESSGECDLEEVVANEPVRVVSEGCEVSLALNGVSPPWTLRILRTDSLFFFGDVDGGLGESRLQHTLGVTGGEDGLLYVADTYNSRIKALDPETNEISTIFGLGGVGGFRDGGADVAEFDEPGGLDYADGKLYVADTNNHAIRVIDLETNEVSTVVFPNPEALQIGEQATVVGGNAAQGLQVTLPEQTVAAGEGEIVLEITLPEGYKLNNLAPFTSEWTASGEAIQISEDNQTQSIVEPELPVRVTVTLTEGSDVLHGELTIYYCEAVQANLCFIDQVGIDVPVTVSADGDEPRIVVERVIEPPVIQEGSF
jgi:DNA-binding beta-propeller fold protein YncE